eukprot:gene17167-23483_t
MRVATYASSADQATFGVKEPEKILIMGGGFGGLYTAVRLGGLFWSKGVKEPEKILIMGGGFGGLYTAVRLGGLFWPKGKQPLITLVDQSSRFTFKPLLYDLLDGSATEEEVSPSLDLLLASYPVRFVQSKVTGIVPEMVLKDGGSTQGGKVALANGAELEYDWLVVALGSQADSRGVPGVKEFALPFNSYEDAMRVKEVTEAISSNNNGGVITIAGAGYAGVELATSIAKLVQGRARVQLLAPSAAGILQGSPEGQRESARTALAQLGVETILGTRVVGLKSASSEGDGGMKLPTSCIVDLQAPDGTSSSQESDLVLWTAGSSPVMKAAEKRKGFPLPISDSGSILTDATLRVASHSRIFALGDVSVSGQGYANDASAPTPGQPLPATAQPLPATAQVAFQQADYVAWNLWAAMNGRPLLPFRYQHLGNMMSLGHSPHGLLLDAASITFENSPLGSLLSAAGIKFEESDPDNGITLEGPVAVAVRRAAYLYRQPTNEQRFNVAASWLTQAASMAADMAGIKMPAPEPMTAPPHPNPPEQSPPTPSQ